MKIILHCMKGCHLCRVCKRMFKEFNIKYEEAIDIPELDRPYPYITIEYEYEEINDMIFDGVIGNAIYKK